VTAGREQAFGYARRPRWMSWGFFVLGRLEIVSPWRYTGPRRVVGVKGQAIAGVIDRSLAWLRQSLADLKAEVEQ